MLDGMLEAGGEGFSNSRAAFAEVDSTDSDASLINNTGERKFLSVETPNNKALP